MAEKMSTLVLKVDFECSKCYNKVRRTLCTYHSEIRTQTNDKKQGTITITGTFDAPSFAKKLNSKAGKAIKGIEIKKKEEEKPKEKPAEKPKEAADKPKEAAAAAAAPKPDKPKAAADPKPDKPKEDKPKDKEKPKKGGEEGGKQDAAKPAAAPAGEAVKAAGASEPGPQMKMIEPGTVLAYPIVQPPPYGGYSVVPCYEGYVGGGGPSVYGGGPGVYDGYYGRPYEGGGYYHGGYGNNNNNNGYYHGGNTNPNANYGTDYFSEKDPSCSIM